MSAYRKIIPFKNTFEFSSLPVDEQEFIQQKADEFHLSFQNIKQLIDIALDLKMWEEGSIVDLWNDYNESRTTGKDRTKLIMNALIQNWEKIKKGPKDYTSFIPDPPPFRQLKITAEAEEKTLLGRCPVASDKTRCCNLHTLDAVKGCGFACSYCSIQSFYNEGNIVFQKNFAEKLRKLPLDPRKIYHIGTGQSSDSLMWGNREGVLDALFDFARLHPNVILELKTKSDNVSFFKNHDVPKNVLVTWSLNTDTIITSEEHLTASLAERLLAAREVADRGLLVGFHFHPMVYYKNWESEYTHLFFRLQEMFNPDEVVLISLGTLTFIKPVIKQLRRNPLKSKILQMPLEDAAGKLSYPLATKRLMFQTAYKSFSKTWKEKVFFYMCMEDPRLWNDVFGYQYDTNEDFEQAMKTSYIKKINEKKGKRSILETGV